MTSGVAELLVPTGAKPKGGAPAPHGAAGGDGFSVALSAATQPSTTQQQATGDGSQAGQASSFAISGQSPEATAALQALDGDSAFVVPSTGVEVTSNAEGAGPSQQGGAGDLLLAGASLGTGEPLAVVLGGAGAVVGPANGDGAVADPTQALSAASGGETAVPQPGGPTANTPAPPGANALGVPVATATPIDLGTNQPNGVVAGDDSGLLIPGALAAAGSGNLNAQAQASTSPIATPANPTTAPSNGGAATNPALQQLAAALATDPRLQADGDGTSKNSQGQTGDGKAALKTAVLTSSPETKPAETGSGSSFSNALGATSGTTTGDATKSVKSATPQQPARAAVPTPATAQIAVHIVRAAADGVSRFNVQLRPAELGRVEVQLEVSRDGAVHARVIADRQETVDQLQRDSRSLERALQDAGLKADSQNLHFSLRGGQKGHDTPENRDSVRNRDDAIDDPAEVAATAMAARWSEVAGSSGALDIRV